MQADRNDGMYIQSIAKKYGVSIYTVCSYTEKIKKDNFNIKQCQMVSTDNFKTEYKHKDDDSIIVRSDGIRFGWCGRGSMTPQRINEIIEAQKNEIKQTLKTIKCLKDAVAKFEKEFNNKPTK